MEIFVATLEAVLAKLAPGMANPDDETPVVDATPDEEAVRRIAAAPPNATTTD